MNLGAISLNKDKSPKSSKFFDLDLKKKKKKFMEERKSSSVSDVGAWGMNIISSVGIIMANKQLMSQTGFAFTFATTLTGFHFSVTALVGWISNATGYSESKPVPFWELLWFSIIANTSIAAMNFSLMLNSVGFYQISKLSMIPVVCIMEWILHGKHYSREVKMAVSVVVVGVGVCTVTDVKVNAKGLLCASVAVLCTSLQQIVSILLSPYEITSDSAFKFQVLDFENVMNLDTFALLQQSIGSLQKKYSIGSFELLSKTAPIQALSLLTVGPFIDYCLTGKPLSKYNYTSGAFCFILLSCSLAVFCNISQYLCIGRFSAVSFQVLGHMKTVCVLTLGWLLFDSEMTLKNISGMVVAIVGMVVYSWAVEIEKQGNANGVIIPQTKSQLSDEELMMLKEGVEESGLRDQELGQVPK